MTRGVQTIDLESWQEFHLLIARDFGHTPAYAFRAHAHADWKVESSLDRWERLHSERHGKLPVSRDTHLRACRQAIRAISPVEFLKKDEALTWAMAQHHSKC